MPDSEISPRAARHLREVLGRRVADDEPTRPDTSKRVDQRYQPFSEPQGHPSSPTAEPTRLAPGSIWGPQRTTAPDSGAPSSPADQPERPNPKHRRRAGEGPPDPDSVSIHAEDSHAWWAQREQLDHLVQPKKRGAAARAQRAAREAFAPAGAEQYARGHHTYGDQSHDGPAHEPTHNYSWDPSDVYTWGSNSQTNTHEPPPNEAGYDSPGTEKTPWDLFGLTSEATWAEVTKRHRELAKQHHPDRYADQSDTARAVAEEKMAEINAAFGDLRKIYRLTDGI